MVISVPITSSSLPSLLSAPQTVQVQQFTGRKQIEIQNLGGNDLFIEVGGVATLAGGRRILATTGTFAMNADDLSRINIISSGGANANVRLTINS